MSLANHARILHMVILSDTFAVIVSHANSLDNIFNVKEHPGWNVNMDFMSVLQKLCLAIPADNHAAVF